MTVGNGIAVASLILSGGWLLSGGDERAWWLIVTGIALWFIFAHTDGQA